MLKIGRAQANFFGNRVELMIMYCRQNSVELCKHGGFTYRRLKVN